MLTRLYYRPWTMRRSVLKSLDKSAVIPLELTAAATAAATAATDEAIHKKTFGSDTTRLIISNDEMNDIIKIVEYLEESGLLIKSVSETIQDEVKK